MSNINSNLQNYRIEVPTANVSEERPDENVFKKAENVRNVTAYGVGAQVIYVNNKRHKTEDRFAGLTKDFISDGGLKEKLNKYNSSVGVNSSGNLFRFTKKGTSLATNFPADSNYQQLTTYNVDLKVNDKARVGSADNTNLEAIANRRIFSIMDKKSKELIRYENNSKNANKLEGLQNKVAEKAEKTLKDQKSKSVSNLAKEKPILKTKEREREREKEKDEKKVMKNNFFEKPKSENTQNPNKFAVVYSKKGEYNSNQDIIEQQRLKNDSDSNYELNDQNYENENYEKYDNENIIGSDNDNNEHLNIEQTKRQNFLTSDYNYNNNLAKAKAKPKSLPKDQLELKQEMKLKKNNYLENQKKFAANLMEQNMKKMKEQQANKNPRNESAETNQNYVNNNNFNNSNKEKPLIPGRKLINQNSYHNFNNTNNNQNKSRITHPNEKSNKLEQINKIFTTEERLENIEKINDCFEKLEIKKVERESMDKIKKKVVLVQKKLRVLQEKGIELNLDDTNNDNENNENEGENAFKEQRLDIHENLNNRHNQGKYDEEEKNYVFHDSDNNVEKENISSKNLNSNSENDLNQVNNANNNNNNKYKNNLANNQKEDKLNFDNVSKIKNSQINNYNNNNNSLQQQVKKPVVDTLEFVKKIQESRRKFASKSPGKSEMLNRSDSFRRSNSESNQNNKFNNNNNAKNKFDLNNEETNNNENDIDYNDRESNLQLLTNRLLASAKNNDGEADKRRKDLEIKQFIERKKKEKKMVELKIQEENKKNWENKVIQLLHLEKTISNKNEKVNYIKKSNSSSTQNYSRQSNSANKVRNDFYIGTKKPNLNTNLDESSILDPDDFYYTVLESKNIIVTQKSQSSNKINSVSVKNSNKSTANELNYNLNYANLKTSDDFQKQNALSRLSDFTQGNNNDIRKSDYNYNLTNNNENNNNNNRKNTNLTNKLSQENFLKFLTENEKITLRSVDSKNSGNVFNNCNNLNYNNQNAEMKQVNKNLTNNNISNSPSNLKLTTDSKLIGSKSSNFNPVMRKSDNLFENNLENNAKKQQQNQNQSQLESLSNKEKELSSSPAFDKSGDKSPSEKKTQKKFIDKSKDDLSDLNPKNSLSERLIDRSDIEKDSFLLQFDNLLMTFANKIKHVYMRKHLSDLINNIIMQEQVKFCYETIKNLCNVGKRAVFNRLKEYANEVHVENIYSVFNNLTLFAKRNAMQRIFQYFAFVRNLESENNNTNNTNNNLDNYKDSDLEEYENLDTKKIEEIKAQYLVYFVGTIDRLFLMQKKDTIERIFEYAKNFSLYNDLHFSGESVADKNDLSSNHLNQNLNPLTGQKQNLITKSSAGGESHEESEYSEQDRIAKYYEYMKSIFDLMTRHVRKDAFNRIKNYSKKNSQQAKLNESQRSYNSNSNVNNTNRDNNSSFNSERKREKIVLSKKSANGENSFSSVFNQNKANSFIAQSHNSSNFSLHPNSLDSPKIRKLQFKIAQKNMEREWLENIDEKYGNNNNNNSSDLNAFNQEHNRDASSANENKSNTSYSNTNHNLQIKDNPLVKSDDENEESKNINYSKLSLDDPFKDSKKKFYEAANSNENNNNIANNNPNNNLNNNEDNSLISNKSYNKNNSVNVNKYSTVNYNEELNLNLGSDGERKKPINSESSQIQHNNRYGSNDNEDFNYSKYNENSINSALSKKKNLPDLSPKLNRATDAIRREHEELEKIKTPNQLNYSSELNKNQQQAFDAAGNLKQENLTPDKVKTDREFFQEEIVEDIQEDNLDVSTSNLKKNSLKDASGRFLGTDIDLSADRDNTSDIDWIYTVSHSKSGSLRDVTGGNLIKQFADLTANKNDEDILKNNNNNKSAAAGLNKEKEEAASLQRNSLSIEYESENTCNNNINIITKKSDKEISFNNNLNKSGKTEVENINNNLLNLSSYKKKEDLESKIKEMQIDAAACKNTEEDYENNYDDFENIEEEIFIEEETDFAKILGEDSTSNVQHGSLFKSRNSFKNGAGAHEEKEKEKQKEKTEEVEKNKLNAAEDIKKSLSHNDEEEEIDLTNKKINLNVIPGKETIESVKDIKSIESDDNDFFKIKNNNNQNVLNLLDDKSSNNKSVSVNVLSYLSPDMGLISDNTSSYNLKDIQLNRETINTDYLTALDKKSENTISTLNRKPEITASKESLLLANNYNKETNNAANKRYESIENSAKKSEMVSSTEKEFLSLAEMDSLSSELAEKILNELIASEVKDREKNLIPKKILKSEAGLVNMLNSLNNTPLNRSLASLDNSMNSTINNTLFSKTVIEQKKENSMKLYIEQIGPKLIDNIVQDITENFTGVCENLNMPYKSNSKEVILAMSLRDRNRLKQSYKYLEKLEDAKNFVKKKSLLENFENINKTIREDDNIISDNYYDNILNECLVDAANEILEKERVYGEMGQPLSWSSRTRITKNKVSNSEFSKNKIAQSVKKELSDMLNFRMGMITENYDYLEPDQINQEREKRSINHINKELNEVEELWKNYEFEETQVKLELSELVLEQLLNEIVEIFEHIHNARKKPDLYQYKSIYACEEIPRLPFQQTNTDVDLDNINQ